MIERTAMRTSILICAALMIPVLPAAAQVQRSGNADARVMQQLQQLQQVTAERANLEKENAKLKEEVDQLKKDNAKLQAARGALEGRAKALEAVATRGDGAGKAAQEQLERGRVQMQELITRFRETTQTLRDVEIERTAAKTRLGERERELKVCVDRNAGLYNLNTEVLNSFENRGVWSSLTEREPFTKLKRIELENLIDGYKYRADELRLQEKQAKSAP
jgi:predicted  nucleic acid-binding Zn-ribbon protein